MIRGERTNLRAVERSDARFLRDLLNEPSVQAGWGTSGVPVSVHLVEQDIEGWIETERSTRYPACLIIESLDRVPLGMVLIQLPDGPGLGVASLSIAIEPISQGQGHGRDALTSVVEALFDEWRLQRIELTCEAGNQRAIGLYESLGFTRESTRAGTTFSGGEWHDQHLFRLLATEPRPWQT
jgi:RimJ/RimL family protein N-acetyltransferase